MKGFLSATLVSFLGWYGHSWASSQISGRGAVVDLTTGDRLYQFIREEMITRDSRVIKVRFQSTLGQNAVFEQLEYKSEEPVRYEIQQYQMGEYGSVVFTPEHLEYLYTRGGVTRQRLETRMSHQMVVDQLPNFISENISQLCSGQELKFYFVVPERLRSYSFRLKLDSRLNCDLYEDIAIEMAPSNFIMALLVKPIVMKWNLKQKRLLEVAGRLPLYRISGGHMVPLRALLRFEYDKRR